MLKAGIAQAEGICRAPLAALAPLHRRDDTQALEAQVTKRS